MRPYEKVRGLSKLWTQRLAWRGQNMHPRATERIRRIVASGFWKVGESSIRSRPGFTSQALLLLAEGKWTTPVQGRGADTRPNRANRPLLAIRSVELA
jgi:hypothetical protein